MGLLKNRGGKRVGQACVAAAAAGQKNADGRLKWGELGKEGEVCKHLFPSS